MGQKGADHLKGGDYGAGGGGGTFVWTSEGSDKKLLLAAGGGAGHPDDEFNGDMSIMNGSIREHGNGKTEPKNERPDGKGFNTHIIKGDVNGLAAAGVVKLCSSTATNQ